MDGLKLILVDPNAHICHAWEKEFAGLSAVEIVNDRFENLPDFDAMVSAANSFGLMDGGVDAAIVRYFGEDLMNRVQQRVIDEFRGEQPVGTSFIIETNHPKHPFLAHTPTMRVPMSISRTDNVYRAMWAMLLAVYRHNRQERKAIRSIACPGLGTATGRVPAKEAALQMALAYRWFLSPPHAVSWDHATARQVAIGYGGDIGTFDRFPPEG